MRFKRSDDFNPLDSLRPIDIAKKKNKIHISNKIRLVIGVCLCLGLIGITFLLGQYIEPVHTVIGYVTVPVQSAYRSVSQWFTDTTTDWKSLRELREENRELREEIEELKSRNELLENDINQLQELEELFELSNYYEAYAKTAAQVVGRSPSNWYETFIINKGSSSQMEKYMPIIVGSGLVGHISRVYTNYAQVTTIVDSSSRIYGQVNRYQQGETPLLIEGGRSLTDVSSDLDTNNLCFTDFITTETDIQVGDEIVTSALGDIYPPGLVIGTVERIVSLEDGRTSRAYIEPAVDLNELNYVLVLTDLWKEDMAADIEGDSE
jgi:rod shape-determining protein MreC